MRFLDCIASAAGLPPSGLALPVLLSRFAAKARRRSLVALTALLPLAAMAQNAANAPRLAADYGKLPLSFEANQGQTDSQVKFLSRGNGYSLFLTDKAAVLALTKADPALANKPGPLGKAAPKSAAPAKMDVVRMELAGASLATKVEGAEPLPGTANYFIGNDPSKWHTDLPTYAKVSYKNVYPGVDLLYYGNQRQLEYDFIVQPHANPSQVKLHFAGAAKLTLTPQGDLTVAAKNGEIAFHKPVIYQNASSEASDSTSQRKPVDGHFVLLANSSVGFALGTYDRGRDLVIDPTLAYSTYLGGAGSDQANAIAVDATGNAYVTGYTLSAKFPTKDPYQPANGNTTSGNAFVTKLNPDGTALIYSTYLGGSGSCAVGTHNISTIGDVGNAIAVDASGAAYVAGQACSSTFPLKEPYQNANKAAGSKEPNAFVTKLNAAGNALVYSTYLGGSGGYSGDYAYGITVDSSGDAYVAGSTFSKDFPYTPGVYQTANESEGNAAFVTEFNPSGSSLVFSTLLGNGVGNDAHAVAIDSSGNVYITGYTISGSFPHTPNAYQSTYKGRNSGPNAFVSKFNPNGTKLLYSTYLGGSGSGGQYAGDQGNGIAADDSGNVYIAGATYSHDFPTLGAYQSTNFTSLGATTGFVAKFNTVSGALIYSTYLGGSGGDGATATALDAKGDVFVTGYTYSYASTSTKQTGFPVTSDAYQSTNNASTNKASNAFLTELNPAGSALVYSTYLGGAGNTSGNGDSGNGIALDSYGNPYIAGYSYSTHFPTIGTSFQPNTNAATGNSNAFIAHFEFPTPSTTTLTSDDNPATLGAKVVFTADVTGEQGTPTGTVSFTIDGGKPIVVTLDDTGHAAYSTTTLTEGLHSVVATYSGDAGNLPSTSKTLSETIDGSTPTATPTVSQTITIADATKGYTVYYTTNGTTPTTSSTKYTGPITITASETLKFIAVAPGYLPSAVRTVTDTIQ